MSYKISNEEREQINELMKNVKGKGEYLRLKVLQLKAEKMKNKAIAEQTGYSKIHVIEIVRNFKKNGLENSIKDKRQGGNNRHLTFEEEEKFLAGFHKRSAKGTVITIKEMYLAFMEKVGKKTNLGSFYRMLKRHNWRKITPRAQHPKSADAATIEASKKLTIFSKV